MASPQSTGQAQTCYARERPRGDLVFPREAIRLGLQSGKVLIQFTIEAGEIVDVQAVESTHPVFADAAIKNIGLMSCMTERGKALHGVRVKVPFTFTLQ